MSPNLQHEEFLMLKWWTILDIYVLAKDIYLILSNLYASAEPSFSVKGHNPQIVAVLHLAGESGVWKKKSPETTLKNWRNPKHHQGTCYPRDFCLVIMMEVLFYLCYQRIGDYGGPSGGISFHPFGVCIFVDIHFCWYPSDNMDWNMVVCFEDRCGISSPNFRCGLFPKWILLNQWSWEEGDMVTWIYINSDSFWRLMEVTNQIQPVIHHLATQMKDNHSPS